MQFLNDFFPLGLLAIIALTVVIFAGGAGAQMAEPQGYWLGELHGDVPETLAGARVLDAKALADLMEKESVVLIDAARVPRRPDNLAPGAVWMPTPHQNIPGSVWIPGIGAGTLEPEFEAYFRQRLMTLTGEDQTRLIVFYCHPQCWASWNAAKRAHSYGYRNIGWYREGAEGWQNAGHTLETAKPEVGH